jgi:hypothetical protein
LKHGAPHRTPAAHPLGRLVDYSQEPQTLVAFRLEPSAVGTLLRLTESGFDQFPAGSRRDEAFRRSEGGWTEQMKGTERHVLQHP